MRKTARRVDAIDPATVRAWRGLGVPAEAIDRVRAALRALASCTYAAAEPWASQVIMDALDGWPVAGVPIAAVELLRAMQGPGPAALACELQLAGLPIVPGNALSALQSLAQPSLNSVNPDAMFAGWGPKWRCFADMALISASLKPLDPRGFVSQAPLPAVDVYVDVATELPEPHWWSNRPPEERRYLTARTRPVQLHEEDLAALGWWEEFHRRRYAQGLPYRAQEGGDSELFRLLDAAASGEISVLDRLTELLPPANAAAVRQLRAGAETAQWPIDFYSDRGLWLIMVRLWPPSQVIDPGRSPFHRWAAFRRAYDFTLERSFDAAWQQITAFTELSSPATSLQKEVENLRAYLTLIGSAQTDALERAISLLKGIGGSRVASKNLQWARSRRRLTVNDRGSPRVSPSTSAGSQRLAGTLAVPVQRDRSPGSCGQTAAWGCLRPLLGFRAVL